MDTSFSFRISRRSEKTGNASGGNTLQSVWSSMPRFAYASNSFKYRYTNAFTEGMNNNIKVLKRIAYGYRNFNNFRNRILCVYGKATA